MNTQVRGGSILSYALLSSGDVNSLTLWSVCCCLSAVPICTNKDRFCYLIVIEILSFHSNRVVQMTFVLIDVIDSYRLHKRLWTKSILTFFLFGKTVFFQVIFVIVVN
jgi:hypothetical protein